MSEQREPDHTEDPRGQDVGEGYPEVNEEDADPGEEELDREVSTEDE
jgi:hypothetical protein